MSEFQQIMDLSQINTAHIKAVFTRLLCKVIEIPIDTGRRTGFSLVTLFNKCKCILDEETGETNIIVDAHDDMLPLLFDMKKNYLKYQLWNCLRLKSKNQIRMYEILKQYEAAKIRTISIKDLKDMLGIKETDYDRYVDFKKNVLEVCKKALQECTDIYFEYEPIKKGKKFVDIKFLIYKNKDFKDPLRLDQFINLDDEVSAPAVGVGSVVTVEEKVSPQPQKKLSLKEEAALVETLEFLSGACEDEFNPHEMRQIYEVLVVVPQYKFPKDVPTGDITFKYYHFLSIQYSNLNRQDQSGRIKNRFAYLMRILKSEAEML